MAREYFCAYHSFLESLTPYGDAEVGRLFRSCLQYSMTGEEPALCGNERFIWPTFKQMIDRDIAAYDAKCEKNRANASGGKRTAANASGGSQEEEKGEYKPDSYESGNTLPKEVIPRITLLLNDGSEYELVSDYVSKMQAYYPDINVIRECKKMSAWCVSNPSRRKTRRGITRFINSWLSSAQKEAEERAAKAGKKTNNIFLEILEGENGTS